VRGQRRRPTARRGCEIWRGPISKTEHVPDDRERRDQHRAHHDTPTNVNRVHSRLLRCCARPACGCSRNLSARASRSRTWGRIFSADQARHGRRTTGRRAPQPDRVPAEIISPSTRPTATANIVGITNSTAISFRVIAQSRFDLPRRNRCHFLLIRGIES
jgi:hypothetical protein